MNYKALTLTDLQELIGKKIYYTGDMANSPATCTIDSIKIDRFHNIVKAISDDDSREFNIAIHMIVFSDYVANKGHRFVMLDAYMKYKNNLIAKWQKAKLN